jgi:hypothetical protein
MCLCLLFLRNTKPEDNFFTTEKTNQVNCLVQFVEHLEDNGHGQKVRLETFFSGFIEGHKNKLVDQIWCINTGFVESAFTGSKVVLYRPRSQSQTSVIQNLFYVQVLKFIQRV